MLLVTSEAPPIGRYVLHRVCLSVSNVTLKLPIGSSLKFYQRRAFGICTRKLPLNFGLPLQSNPYLGNFRSIFQPCNIGHFHQPWLLSLKRLIGYSWKFNQKTSPYLSDRGCQVHPRRTKQAPLESKSMSEHSVQFHSCVLSTLTILF